MTGRIEHFDFFDQSGQTVLAYMDKLIDFGLDVVGNVYRDVAFASFSYATGETAIEAFDSDFELGNLLQLQVDADEATLIGNDNDAVTRRWAA